MRPAFSYPSSAWPMHCAWAAQPLGTPRRTPRHQAPHTVPSDTGHTAGHAPDAGHVRPLPDHILAAPASAIPRGLTSGSSDTRAHLAQPGAVLLADLANLRVRSAVLIELGLRDH